MDTVLKLKRDNPRKRANVFSKLFFAWIIKLFYTGTKRSLQLQDLYKVLECDRSEDLGDQLELKWQEELYGAKQNNRKPSLLRAITRTFWKPYSFNGLVWFVILMGLRAPHPIVLSWLISQFEEGQVHERASMYIAAAVLVAMSILTVFLTHHNNYGQSCVGMRVRIAVSSLVYRKILKLDKKSQSQTAAGKLVNLLSNDVQRFDSVCIYLHFLWVMPFEVALITYFLWNAVGISCLAGILSMILCTLPLQGYLGKVASSLRLKVARRTDARVKLMSEIISGVQVIKMYVWEKPFEKLIDHLRSKEINALTKTSYLYGFYLSCMVFIERSTLFLTLLCFTLVGNHARANIVFSLAQFFNILQSIMAIMYPLAISLGAETLVSIKRLEEFLLVEDKPSCSMEIIEEPKIILKSVSAAWEYDNYVLNKIDLSVSRGSLCAIVGPVGAGKSSLLQLLLGELAPATGSIKMGGNVSYSAQEPWLFAASIRQNIIFERPYESAVYKEVTKVCALESDFVQLPYGDKTLVGERGVSLSGGQKARVNLARAVYRQADIYLLDDPLSAVDTHVGKHLFDKCIMQYLKGKTRILVTHQLQYLKKADLIVVLNEGKIEAMGAFKQLSKADLDFTKMLASADEASDEQDKEQLLRRKISTLSSDTDNESSLEQTIEQNEALEIGGSKGESPFWDYLKSVGNGCFVAIVILILLISQAACTCTDLWVAFWTSQEELQYTEQIDLNLLPNTSDIHNMVYEHSATPNFVTTNIALCVYGGLILSTILLTVARSFLFFKAAMRASKNVHLKMFHSLLQAPMRFFNINPSGRVLNRFSKDIGAIDEVLPRVLMESVQIVLVMGGILVNVTVSNYYMVVAIVLLGGFFLKMRAWYVASAKDIKHLEGIAKSPVFSHLSSSLNGLTTIRAANAEKHLIKEFDEHQDVHTAAWFLTIMCTCFFGLWFDVICLIFTTCIAFGFVICMDYGQPPSSSLVGLALSQALILTGMLQYGMRQTAEVINQLTSVERVFQYTKLEIEGPFETAPGKLPLLPWPCFGKIEFKNLTLAYAADQEPVLKNLNFLIKAGQKVGIVGRTGAGKSSLIAGLFRLAPIQGKILIDDLDIASVGLSDLRKRISIIPQEPVLFSATLRDNLDPFKEFEDDKLWEALEEVELKDLVVTLDFQVSAGGSNFSLGQRQLLCLARALLRNNKILILDEATANIDARTDKLIQRTIRRKFKTCTVLTIAHRLNTIMDSDKVMVVNAGEILEFDHPHKLLQMPCGYFTKLVMETGPSMTEQLKNIALQAWKTDLK